MALEVHINKETYQRMQAFTKLAQGEVGGLCRVKEINGRLEVYDLQLFPDQSCYSASVDASHESILKFLSLHEKPGQFKCIWHSHVNMTTSMSSIDLGMIDELMEDAEYFISIITNKRNQMGVDLFGKMFGQIVRVPEVHTVIESDVNIEKYRKEFDSHVTEKKYEIGEELDISDFSLAPFHRKEFM